LLLVLTEALLPQADDDDDDVQKAKEGISQRSTKVKNKTVVRGQYDQAL